MFRIKITKGNNSGYYSGGEPELVTGVNVKVYEKKQGIHFTVAKLEKLGYKCEIEKLENGK